MICLGVHFFEFVWLMVCSNVSWQIWLMCLGKFVKLSVIISAIILHFMTVFFLLSFWNSDDMGIRSFAIVHGSRKSYMLSTIVDVVLSTVGDGENRDSPLGLF